MHHSYYELVGLCIVQHGFQSSKGPCTTVGVSGPPATSFFCTGTNPNPNPNPNPKPSLLFSFFHLFLLYPEHFHFIIMLYHSTSLHHFYFHLHVYISKFYVHYTVSSSFFASVTLCLSMLLYAFQLLCDIFITHVSSSIVLYIASVSYLEAMFVLFYTVGIQLILLVTESYIFQAIIS